MTTAILCTSHGTVERADDLPAFLANIRRGRPVDPAVLAEVRRRFEQIGGSPLGRLTAAQAAALSARLGVPVFVAGRLWDPYPKAVLAEMVRQGVTRVVSLPLAPYSVHVYHADVRAAAAAHEGLEVAYVPAWNREPALLDAFVESVDEGLALLPEGARAAVTVVLTAHSLPQRVVDAGDPYAALFEATYGLVAERLQRRGLAVRLAYQSQGMTGDAWLGPDLATTLRRAREQGAREVLVAPIGFVADHVETLYDLDVEAHALAAQAGLDRLERAPAMNARPRFIDALEAVARPLL